MILRLLPVLTVMASIFMLSHLPGDNLDFKAPAGTDKFFHALIYGFLALSVIYAVRSESDKQKTPLLKGLGILIFCTMYGVSDELHQSFIDGRSQDWRDLVADTLGALLVVSGWWHWLYHRPERKNVHN